TMPTRVPAAHPGQSSASTWRRPAASAGSPRSTEAAATDLRLRSRPHLTPPRVHRAPPGLLERLGGRLEALVARRQVRVAEGHVVEPQEHQGVRWDERAAPRPTDRAGSQNVDGGRPAGHGILYPTV